MKLGKTVAMLRKVRGWTQEELAERCGLSVRTIRNVELGWVENPRQSSVNLLMRALDAEGVESSALGPPGGTRWRGVPAPHQPIIGMRRELEDLTRTVLTSRLTTLLGFGGVGKTRVALAAAATAAVTFRYGVALVELGDIPAETQGSAPPTALVLDRVRRVIDDRRGWDEPAQDGAVADQLLVLDNAEHLPSAVTAAALILLRDHPRVHILITTRRPLTERLGASRELGPLAVEPAHEVRPAQQREQGGEASLAPAVELVLRRSAAAVDLGRDLPAVTELCRRLGGIPRALEFATERLRTIPIHVLLASGPALSALRTSDHSLLPHQRSLGGSIQWSVDLLSDDHRRLLRRIAGMATTRFSLDQVVDEAGPPHLAMDSALCLFSDLVDNALVAPAGELYEYRLMPYVREVICAEETPRHAYALGAR